MYVSGSPRVEGDEEENDANDLDDEFEIKINPTNATNQYVS